MFEEQLEEIIIKYPDLEKLQVKGITILKGSLEIVDSEGKKWDNYQIEIHPKKNFPYCFPTLYEVGEKIPINADWHIYEHDKSCCLTVMQKEIYTCRNGITLLEYIENWVIPYLANQTYRFIHGNYANGEYPHGIIATVIFYQDIFRTRNIRHIIFYISFILKNRKPNRADICFCGSKQKLRKCHKEAFEICITLSDNILQNDLKILEQYLKLNSMINLMNHYRSQTINH